MAQAWHLDAGSANMLASRNLPVGQAVHWRSDEVVGGMASSMPVAHFFKGAHLGTVAPGATYAYV